MSHLISFSNATSVHPPTPIYSHLFSAPLFFLVWSFLFFLHPSKLFFIMFVCLPHLPPPGFILFLFFLHSLSTPLLSSSLSLLFSFFPHYVYIMVSPQACEIPETAVFSLAPSEEAPQAKPYSVPCWDLLQTSVQGKVEYPLPIKHMLFSLFPRPDAGGVGSAAWSLPAPVRPDFPRQSLSVPGELDSGVGLNSRWVKRSICGLLAVTVHLELGFWTPAGTGHQAERHCSWSQLVKHWRRGKRRNALNISTVNLSSCLVQSGPLNLFHVFVT